MPGKAGYVIEEKFEFKTPCGLKLVFKSSGQRSQWEKLHKKTCECCANGKSHCPSFELHFVKMNG